MTAHESAFHACFITVCGTLTLISVICTGVMYYNQQQTMSNCGMADWNIVGPNTIQTDSTVLLNTTFPVTFAWGSQQYQFQISEQTGELQLINPTNNQVLVSISNATFAIGPHNNYTIQDTVFIAPSGPFQATPFRQNDNANPMRNTGSGFAFGDANGVCHAGIQAVEPADGEAGQTGIQIAVGINGIPTRVAFFASNGFSGINTNAPRSEWDVNGLLITQQLSIRSSDRKFKTNVQKINQKRAWLAIKQVEACEYDRKDTGKHEYGFIAQQIQTIPLLYNTVLELSDGTLAVDYEQILAVLVAAVQYITIQS